MSTEIQKRGKKRTGLRALFAATLVAGILMVPFIPPLVRYVRIKRM